MAANQLVQGRINGAIKEEAAAVLAAMGLTVCDTTPDVDLGPILELLANDEALDPRCRDHALTGNWSDHRDCHVKPDLVLVYLEHQFRIEV
jgi:addiction module RelE/StbE family toxin